MEKDNLISVVVCTYNRCESVRDTLAHLAKMKCDNTYDYEVILVDNNSSDDTKTIVMAAQPLFNGRLKYIFEEKQGVSNARNRGMKEAQGSIIVFTDDDINVDSNWLNSTYKTFIDYEPDCVYGKIYPLWGDHLIPKWLLENQKLWANLAMLDHGDEAFKVTKENQHFFGANFAVRKQVYIDGFRFDANLGIQGDVRMQGEDTALFYWLFESNRTIMYQPESVVWHKVEEERTKKKYFRDWNYNYGMAQARMDKEKDVIRYFKVPRWIFRHLCECLFKCLGSSIMGKFKRATDFELRFYFCLGYIKGSLKGY